MISKTVVRTVVTEVCRGIELDSLWNSTRSPWMREMLPRLLLIR